MRSWRKEMRPIRLWKLFRTLLVLMAASAATGTLFADSSAPLPTPPQFVRQWGGLGQGEGQLFMPWGIAVGPDNEIFVVDYGNNRIQVFSADGLFLRGWGGLGTQPGRFRGPVGIAVGADGTVYVSDAFNYRVQVFTPDGEFLRLWGGPASESNPFTPWGIAVDSEGNVYVSDLHAHRVYKFSGEGELLRSWGGLGTAEGKFTGPTGVAISPDGKLYVVDSLGYRVQVFTLDGEFLFKWGSYCSLYIHEGAGCVDPDGPGPLESGDGQFESPWGIAFDPQGRVYVADSANKRIQLFTPKGDFLLKWGRLGRKPGEFDNPVGVAVDRHGDVYVADLNNNRIQVFTFSDSDAASSSQSPPVILAVELPSKLALNGSPIMGTVRYRDPDGDLKEARFHVIDGKFDPFTIELDEFDDTDGEFSFSVTCTIAQEVTLKLVLVDRAGRHSKPKGFSFTCGDPPQGNYDQEQTTVRATRYTLGLNLFILEDGVNTLSEGAVFTNNGAVLGQPRRELQTAIERQVLPAVTGIWDQCGVEYELQNLRVVRPQKLALSGGSLDELLFVRTPGRLPEVAISDPERRRPLEVLEDALGPLGEVLEAGGSRLDPQALNVFITGARIVFHAGDERHFGGVTTLGGRISLVRWDAIWVIDEETGEIFPPKRPITAIAHELGHNFNLEHISPREDPLNLMLSVSGQPTAVPPQPTVHLLPSQCEQAEPTIIKLNLRTATD